MYESRSYHLSTFYVLYQVRDKTAFSIHFSIVHHIKITIHLPYCDPELVFDNSTKINYTIEDCVVFS